MGSGRLDTWTLEFRDAAGGIFLPHCHELSDMNSEPGSSQFSVFDVRASAHPGTAPARAWHALGTAKTSIKRALARCHTHFHPPARKIEDPNRIIETPPSQKLVANPPTPG